MSIQPLNPSSQGVERAGLARGSAQEDEAVAGDGAGGAFAGLLAAQDEAPVAADPALNTERKDEEVADAATDPQAGAQAMGLLLAQSAWTQTRTAATELPGQEASTSTDTSKDARPGQADATAPRETPATEAASAARRGSAAAAWEAALGLPTAALAQTKTAASAPRPQALPAAAARAAARDNASTSITAAATQRERAQEPGGRWAPRALMPVAAPVEAAALAMNAAAPQLARAQNTEGITSGSALPGAAMVADAPSSLADPQAGQGAAASPSPEAASFANELADQVSWWLSQKTQGAEMTLDGPGGEPVAVSVQIQGHEAHIAFRSEQAATRQLLSGALGQLEQMLGSSGLALGQVSLGSGMAGREERRTPAAPERVGAAGGAGRTANLAPGQAGVPATGTGALRGGVNGAVDLYV